MSWEVKVHYYDETQKLEMKETELVGTNTPCLGPAIEQALHKLELSRRRRGSYQITVTQR